MIELDSLTKQFDGTVAVDDVDLTCPTGEITVLIGPSGCGKSTILRSIIGLVTPDSGRVTVDGTDVADADLQQLRRRIGYVIQSGGLFPHMTARDNVALMADELGWSDERIGDKVDELTELTHFPREGLDKYPGQLSGGQKQRVSLMRALVLDPDFLLLDEPLGALDPMIRADLQSELKSIFDRLETTVVLVTHDMDEAAFFGDTIALLRNGRLVQSGRLRELLDEPADDFVTEFIDAQRSTLDAAASDEVALREK